MRVHSRLLFFTLYLVYFLDLAGIGIIYVILAPLIVESPHLFALESYTVPERNVLLGLLYGAYPLTQFFAAPILGELSDCIGRKKPFLFSSILTGLSFCLTAVSVQIGSLSLLFLSRLVSGMGAGNMTIALASVADFVEPAGRPKKMGFFNMVGGSSWIITPYLGALLSGALFISAPFWAAALLFFVAAYLIHAYYPEAKSVSAIPSEFHPSKVFRNILKAFQIPKVSPVLGISILSIFAWMVYQAFIAPYLNEKYQFSTAWIGATFAYFSAWWLIGGLLANQFLLKRFKASWVNIAPMFVAPAAIFSYLFFSRSAGVWPASAAANVAEGLACSCFFALFSTLAKQQHQGKLFGCWNAGFALSSALTPVLSGWLSRYSLDAPFLCAALLHSAAAFLYVWWMRKF